MIAILLPGWTGEQASVLTQGDHLMAGYAARRVLAAIPVLLFVSFVTFGLIRLAPGDPVLIVLGGKRISPQLIEQLREQFGLVGDPITQYVRMAGAGAAR